MTAPETGPELDRQALDQWRLVNAELLTLLAAWETDKPDMAGKIMPSVRDQIRGVSSDVVMLAAGALMQYMLNTITRLTGKDRDTLLFELREATEADIGLVRSVD